MVVAVRAVAVAAALLAGSAGARVVGTPAAPETLAVEVEVEQVVEQIVEQIVEQVPETHLPGRALLKLRPTSRAAAALVDVDALKALGARTGLELSLVKQSILGWLVVDLRPVGGGAPDEDETLALIARLAADDAVAAASENRWARAFATPNDPSFNQMWHLSQTRLPAAWDDEQGNSAQRIGVVDTGLLRNHEDVGSKAVVGFDFIGNGTTAGDGDGRDADFTDNGDSCNGSANSFHGTHVAGTIAAATDNGVGIAGVNWNARLAIVRALGRCGGDIVDIMEGSVWLAGGQVAGVPSIGADRVTVMNLSLGSRGNCTAFEQDAVNAIDAAGVVFVAAAGNDGGVVNSPANCNNVVSVAAHDRSMSRASYSSFGAQIDIVAPGGDISGGYQNGVLSTLGPTTNAYAFYQGTSMAAPHVAGVISLLQAKDPSLGRVKAEQALIQGGQACSNCSGKVALDAAGALAQVVRGGSPPDPVDPTDPPAVDDAFEDNDLVAVARRLRCGDTHDLVALPRDQDWFFVDVDVGPFSVGIDAGAADFDLYLVRDDTEILLRSETTTGVESITADVTRPQRLQLLVNPFANDTSAATGPYRLTLSCTATADTPPPDPTEPAPVDPTDPAPVDPGDPVDPGVDLTAPDVGAADDRITNLGGPPLATGGCAAVDPTPLGVPGLALLLISRRRRRR